MKKKLKIGLILLLSCGAMVSSIYINKGVTNAISSKNEPVYSESTIQAASMHGFNTVEEYVGIMNSYLLDSYDIYTALLDSKEADMKLDYLYHIYAGYDASLVSDKELNDFLQLIQRGGSK